MPNGHLELVQHSNVMFTLVPIFIGVIFCVVIGSLIFRAGKGVAQWNYNNNQPVMDVPARVLGKRANTVVRNHHHHAGDSSTIGHDTVSSRTEFTITFELDGSKERL